MSKRRKGKEVITDDMEDEHEDTEMVYEDPFDDEYEEEEEVEEVEEEEEEEKERVWWPGMEVPAEQEMEYEMSAYDMIHQLNVEWPCLSFAIMKDDLGASRKRYPMTMYIIAGTQADRQENNKLVAMKISHLCRTKHDVDTDSDVESEGEDDDSDDDPMLDHRTIPHVGAVNRLRVMPQKPNIVASWSETGNVHLWDIGDDTKALDRPPTTKLPVATPKHTFKHKVEGYALDWSNVVEGRFASGDNNGKVHIWQPSESGWVVERAAYQAKSKVSVEDIQWSPVEETVFAACGVDKCIRVWDIRMKERKRAALTVKDAHLSDVNVISWHDRVTHALASGGDDGAIKIWDLRLVKDGGLEPTGHFAWHQGAVTSVEWDPHDEGGTSLAATSEDGKVSYWDLAVEAEEAAELRDLEIEGAPVGTVLPPQLLFVHSGISDPKEVHYHPQIEGVSIVTSADGFHVIRPSNLCNYAKE